MDQEKIALVKALRARTGESMMVCKKALEWSSWDLERAHGKLCYAIGLVYILTGPRSGD
jgi:translation elongation factor EF-Ts